MCQPVDAFTDDLGGASGGADGDRPAARHSLCNDEPEGLRFRAGVHNDIERAQCGFWPVDIAGEADHRRYPETLSKVLQLD